MKNQPRHHPEFMERTAWLRIQNREPLRLRFIEFLGQSGSTLLDELQAAYRKAEAGSGEAFERYARHVLRKCGRALPDHNQLHRRPAYIRACIADLSTVADLGNLEFSDPENYSPPSTQEVLAVIARTAGVTCEEVWKTCVELISIFETRWPDNPEKGISRILSIVTKASCPEIKYPLKYLARIVENEQLVNKQRNRKQRGSRKSKKMPSKSAQRTNSRPRIFS